MSPLQKPPDLPRNNKGQNLIDWKEVEREQTKLKLDKLTKPMDNEWESVEERKIRNRIDWFETCLW